MLVGLNARQGQYDLAQPLGGDIRLQRPFREPHPLAVSRKRWQGARDVNGRPGAGAAAAGAAEPHILARIAGPVGADLMSYNLVFRISDWYQNTRRPAQGKIGSALLAQQKTRHIQHHSAEQVIESLGQARTQHAIPLAPALITPSPNRLFRELPLLNQVLLMKGAQGQVAVQRPVDLI